MQVELVVADAPVPGRLDLISRERADLRSDEAGEIATRSSPVKDTVGQ